MDAARAVTAMTATTRDALGLEMLRQQAAAAAGVVSLLESAKAALPPGVGTRLDRSV